MSTLFFNVDRSQIEKHLRAKGLYYAFSLSVMLHVGLAAYAAWSIKNGPQTPSEVKQTIKVQLQPLPATLQDPRPSLPPQPQVRPKAGKSLPAPALAPSEPAPAPATKPVAEVTPQLPSADLPSSQVVPAAAPETSAATPSGPAVLAAEPERYQAAQFNAAYLRNPAPRYPTLSRQLQEEGRVDLQVDVNAEGFPIKVVIHKGSGFPRLDKAALEAVSAWRFVPAYRGGRAERSTVIVPLIFNLQNQN